MTNILFFQSARRVNVWLRRRAAHRGNTSRTAPFDQRATNAIVAVDRVDGVELFVITAEEGRGAVGALVPVLVLVLVLVPVQAPVLALLNLAYVER